MYNLHCVLFYPRHLLTSGSVSTALPLDSPEIEESEESDEEEDEEEEVSCAEEPRSTNTLRSLQAREGWVFTVPRSTARPSNSEVEWAGSMIQRGT